MSIGQYPRGVGNTPQTKSAVQLSPRRQWRDGLQGTPWSGPRLRAMTVRVNSRRVKIVRPGVRIVDASSMMLDECLAKDQSRPNISTIGQIGAATGSRVKTEDRGRKCLEHRFCRPNTIAHLFASQCNYCEEHNEVSRLSRFDSSRGVFALVGNDADTDFSPRAQSCPPIAAVPVRGERLLSRQAIGRKRDSF